MTIYAKMAIVVVLMAAIGTAVVLKNGGTCSTCPPGPVLLDPSAFNAAAQSATALPRLVELGSTTCVPCKMMKPILDELTAEYAGTLAVEFIDVHAQPAQAAAFNVRVIPTQVFLDASGKELFRHEGFFPKEDILAQWAKLGYDLVQHSKPAVE
jgi:thioredoxin 1